MSFIDLSRDSPTGGTDEAEAEVTDGLLQDGRTSVGGMSDHEQGCGGRARSACDLSKAVRFSETAILLRFSQKHFESRLL